jgi:ABC-2 type transport system ATP-binding protein
MSALIIQDLKKTYQNGVEALKGISFQVRNGAFFALLGPNGAGKSTTIGIITSLINKTSGKVTIFDADLDKEGKKAKQMIGLVPQEFNFNIFDKVQISLIKQGGYYGIDYATAKKRSEKYLRYFKIWHKREERIRFISGGQKRRLLIARALIHEPPLLILDEPTAGVDIELRRELWHFLRELNRKGTTIILTTHYLEEAEYLCEDIVIINHGKIIEDTSMKEVLKKLSVETFILNLQNPLTAPPEIKDFSIKLVEKYVLEVIVREDQTLNLLFTELSKQRVIIRSMRNKANRLEELFIYLTKNAKTNDNTL